MAAISHGRTLNKILAGRFLLRFWHKRWVRCQVGSQGPTDCQLACPPCHHDDDDVEVEIERTLMPISTMKSPTTSAFINFAALTTRWCRIASNQCNKRTYFSNWNGSGEQNQDRFNDMEHRNWELGYEVYDQGFGPLTQQTISTLLAGADFPPAQYDVGRLVRILDVATGPGFVLSASVDAVSLAAEKQHHQFQLTGLDISQNFLMLAEQRVDAQMQQPKNQPNAKQIKVDFVNGSAELLPFPENVFDSVVCNFGILHFFDPIAFLRESFRVLRPGGRMSFSAWAPPTRTEGFRIALESIAEAGNPIVVGLPEGPSFFDFGDAQHATTTLESVGFEKVNSVELGEMKWSNIKNGTMLYHVLLNGTSRTREILLGQTPEETTAIQVLMEKKFDFITDYGKVPLSMPAVVTAGQKPK